MCIRNKQYELKPNPNEIMYISTNTGTDLPFPDLTMSFGKILMLQ